MSFTPDSDKRDLAIVFGLDRKVQEKDSFFHNANSLIKKDVWDKIHFDEKVTNIEDRVWAQEVIKMGFKIIYEPEASVYHYHGIHQDSNEERCTNVVRILESLQNGGYKSIEADLLKVTVIIPVRGEVRTVGGRPLLAYTIESARESKYVKRVVVSTDNARTAELACSLGAEVPFMREPHMSMEHVDLDQVMKYSLEKLEGNGIISDILVPLEITFPFRPKGMLDEMILHLTQKGLDSVVVARRENKAIWKKKGEDIVLLEEGLTPRKLKDPSFIEMRGIAMVTHPEFIRQGRTLGDKIGFYELDDPYSHIEVRGDSDVDLADILIEKKGNKNRL
jgi:CMP-N-acetylneuraminic acid synthetase